MREILFRGKRLGTDEWIYGYYNVVTAGGKDYHYICWQGNDTQVVTETVGQYTGFDDKNGVPIFEGDKYTAKHSPMEREVRFVAGAFCGGNGDGFGPLGWDTDDSGNEDTDWIPEEVEVAGNIYDK